MKPKASKCPTTPTPWKPSKAKKTPSKTRTPNSPKDSTPTTNRRSSKVPKAATSKSPTTTRTTDGRLPVRLRVATVDPRPVGAVDHGQQAAPRDVAALRRAVRIRRLQGGVAGCRLRLADSAGQ